MQNWKFSPPKPAPAGDLQISAERRPITVMFCDLVGSTSLAAKLDAEDWRNLVWALRLRELGMIKSSPDKIIATGTDWRFLKEVRKELGI